MEKNQKDIEISSGNYPILGTGGVMGYTDIPLYSKTISLDRAKRNN